MIEYNYIINNSGTCSSSTYVYYRQCGWSDYTYNGVERYMFTFNNGIGDMDDHHFLQIRNYQTQLARHTSNSLKSSFESGSWKFAGLICIDVPGKII